MFSNLEKRKVGQHPELSGAVSHPGTYFYEALVVRLSCGAGHQRPPLAGRSRQAPPHAAGRLPGG